MPNTSPSLPSESLPSESRRFAIPPWGDLGRGACRRAAGDGAVGRISAPGQRRTSDA